MVSSFTFALFISSTGSTDRFSQGPAGVHESTYLRVSSTIIGGRDHQDYVEQ
jgi:hypothetical protein